MRYEATFSKKIFSEIPKFKVKSLATLKILGLDGLCYMVDFTAIWSVRIGNVVGVQGNER